MLNQMIMLFGFLLSLACAFLSAKMTVQNPRVLDVLIMIGYIMFGVGLFLTLATK